MTATEKQISFLRVLFLLLAGAIIMASVGCIGSVNPDLSPSQKALVDLKVARHTLDGMVYSFAAVHDRFPSDQQLQIRAALWDVHELLSQAEDMALDGQDPNDIVRAAISQIRDIVIKYDLEERRIAP